MRRHVARSCIISLSCVFALACPAGHRTGITERIGDWRVEVGPPGNEFYQAPAPATQASPPSQALFELVKRIAPIRR